MDVISAIATAPGRGGVAIVRMSGDGAPDIAKNMFSRKGEFEPNVMYAGTISCADFSDFGMCVYFRAPKSFTGEDVIEFHCHGGTEIARGVLERTLSLGARAAERGEFTKRAFLNGKLSLSAAEGMADMINAEARAQVRAGYLLYGEKLTNEGRRLQSLLTECLAGIDADVDYPEEDLNTETRGAVVLRLKEVKRGLNALLKQYRAGRKIKSGVNAVICGKPNAGKSSLLNALLGYDKAIVSPQAGTTRDAVEGSLEIGGVLFRLTDTAGLRDSADEIEREGIRRAENAVRAADLVIWLKEDGEILPELPQDTPVITVGSKCDICSRSGADVNVSAVTGEGLDKLKALMYERGVGADAEGAYLMEERHYRAVERAAEAAERAIAAAEGGLYAELYAEDVKSAWLALGELSGETSSEAVISEIFEKFCVGK